MSNILHLLKMLAATSASMEQVLQRLDSSYPVSDAAVHSVGTVRKQKEQFLQHQQTMQQIISGRLSPRY